MGNNEEPKRNWPERGKAIRHRWLVPFAFVEWICEWISYVLGRWAFLDILEHIGRLTILIAVITYFMEADVHPSIAEAILRHSDINPP